MAWLASLYYECYYITPSDLVPITGAWWDAGFEIWKWSNVVCHKAGDWRGEKLVAFYNRERPVLFSCPPLARTSAATAQG